MGFYGSNDPTNSVKALKDYKVQGLGFNPTRSTPTHMQYEKTNTKYININTGGGADFVHI